jgi:hypothetical protein
MLLPFIPFTPFGWDLNRPAWVAMDVVVAIWAFRRLGVPPYWLIFPPLFEAIVLGHPEVLVLGLLAIRHPISGLAMLIKPYAAFPYFAERRWRAFVVAVVVGAATLVFLPWRLFLEDLPVISATLARQSAATDSVFGQPIPMVIAAIALASLGLRRALWLSVPVLWPGAQPIYKSMTIPALVPVVAVAWALPVPGATLFGIVAYALLFQIDRRRGLPAWLQHGIIPTVPEDRWGGMPTAAAVA